MGFVNFSYPKAELREETVKLAKKLMEKSPAAMRYTKEAIRAVRFMNEPQAADYLNAKSDALRSTTGRTAARKACGSSWTRRATVPATATSSASARAPDRERIGKPWTARRNPRAQSTPAKSRTFRGSPGNGGTRAVRWATLHRFNPVRLGYIRDRTAAHFGRDPGRLDSLDGPAHPRYRLRRRRSVRAAGAARRDDGRRRSGRGKHCRGAHHAAQAGLTIDYRSTTAEALAEAGERFDVVLAMEVVEHVADFDLFVESSAGLVKPGGLMFVATLNRTMKSFALAIVGAEYILRWIPRGTHQWDKFITPDELEIAIEQSGPAHHRRDRRDLQFVCRPLAALHRHGRQLHGRRGEGRVILVWLALGRLYRHRRVLPDPAQRHAARAHAARSAPSARPMCDFCSAFRSRSSSSSGWLRARTCRCRGRAGRSGHG